MRRLLELVRFARLHSKFYSELYKGVAEDCDDISRYPVISQEAFWQASENGGGGLLTASHQNGIVFKSGGTAGNPKYSYFTAKEWNDFTSVSGKGFRLNGVKAGDRIANLFYAGELYASFLYVTDLIQQADVGVCFPISGQTAVAESVALMKKLDINVMAGVPTTIMHVISYLQKHGDARPEIDLILFGGEPMYPDQLEAIARCFPRARVHSILYASVDGGELGYFDAATCKNGEHRTFDESTILEIVEEESGAVISRENVPGKLLVTNLNRRLMPLIRYPVGDLAAWSEPEGRADRKFRLLGRSEEGARIGPATLYVQDLLTVFNHFAQELHILNFQLLITHEQQKDRVVIKVVPHQPEQASSELATAIVDHLYDQRSMLKELLAKGTIHPLGLQWCSPDELESNARTGKTKRVLDRRLGS
ncbi:phenylacetate--CoA ligase family protein [Desulfogranum mediterraneum]|uniref:phenylacetate--CoA ligase family protein n=1 Tax=Desulfogranum mediterraneum TaxID=160661 RepID=UPI000419648D|nr:phenylacetate--CoA ligase family protein [Desulfogranum mediterraneum]